MVRDYQVNHEARPFPAKIKRQISLRSIQYPGRIVSWTVVLMDVKFSIFGFFGLSRKLP